jgi:hypothetical protein
VGSSSDVVTSAATVGPDVATSVTGGLLVLAALSWQPARRPTLLLLLAAFVASVTKLTDFTAVGVAMTVLLGKAFVARNDGKRGLLAPLVASAAVATVFVAMSAAWFYRPTPESVALIGAPHRSSAPVVVPWEGLKSTLLFNFFPPNVGNFNANFLEGVFNARLEQLMAGLMVFGVLAVVLAGRRTGIARSLGIGVLLMVVLGPVILTILNKYAYNQFFVLPARYGYGLLAPLIATTAWPFCRGASSRALVLLAVVSYLSVFL